MFPEPTPRRAAAVAQATQSGERSLEEGVELAPGTLLAGKYRIKAVLGRGGFATVYDAEQIAFARDVALKVLHRTDATPPVLLERFAREVRISARVRHPNVLEVYDAGVLDDGSPFLVMEKIAGPTLHEWLGRVQRLSIEQTLELGAQLLAALAAIGAQGIVHRDIKPENLMLAAARGPAPQLKLVDFGIALVREERMAPRLTARGALIGTPQYMAPEQLRSEITDARVDLYAAGVVMYQALTGALPHDAPDLSTLTLRVLAGRWRPVRALRPDCPRRLARLVERALASEPARRFSDAASMATEIEACRAERAGRVCPGRGERWLSRLPRARSARAGLLALAIMTAGALQAGVVVAFRRVSGAPQPAEAGAAPRSAGAIPARARAPRSEPKPTPGGVAAAAAAAAEPPSALALASARSNLDGSGADEREPGAQPAASAGSGAGEPEPRAAAERARRSPLRADVSAQAQRARAAMRRGLSLHLHGELEAAYAAYRQASLLAPRDPAAFRALGLLASQLERDHEARQALARYLELSGDAADAARIRARIQALPRGPGDRSLSRAGGP